MSKRLTDKDLQNSFLKSECYFVSIDFDETIPISLDEIISLAFDPEKENKVREN